MHYNTLQHTALHCNMLQHTAPHCNTCSKRGQRKGQARHHTTAHYNTLQCTTTHCNALQHTATRCNTLQHAATHAERMVNAKDKQDIASAPSYPTPLVLKRDLKRALMYYEKSPYILWNEPLYPMKRALMYKATQNLHRLLPIVHRWCWKETLKEPLCTMKRALILYEKSPDVQSNA